MKKHFTPMLALCLLLLAAPQLYAGEVNLSVAASLKEVINELCAHFVKQNPGIKFVKNCGGSGSLAKQIENGVPADIFISANVEWMDDLRKKKVLEPATVKTFTYNTLVFAGAAGKKVGGMNDLGKLEKIAIGSPKSVPAGEYALEAMKKAGVQTQVEKKLVMAKDVRECLLYAERGEVDGAFVYLTDALQGKKVKVLFTVPQQFYPRVVYPMGLTTAGAKNKDAEAFFRYLQGRDAKVVLGKYGFPLK